jgi:hypothetical protein
MATQTIDLWELTHGKPQIDPADLAEAVCQQAGQADLDYRTRLLIRDSVTALRTHWGEKRVENWLAGCPHRERIEAVGAEEFDKIGFPTIPRRLIDKTKPEVLLQLLDGLGQQMSQETTVCISGSVALILSGYLSQHTDDIEFVHDFLTAIQGSQALREKLEGATEFIFGYVPGWCFPHRWRERVHLVGTFGKLQAFRLDVYDVILSKLFSERQGDLDDMRLCVPQLDQATLLRLFQEECALLLERPSKSKTARWNWQFLFGEPLPS